MRKLYKLLSTTGVALCIAGSAFAGDRVVYADGGDVWVGEGAQVVIVKAVSTVHLTKANEDQPAVLVTSIGPQEGTRVVVDGQTIQGQPYLEFAAPDVSVALHPVNGLGYVR